MLSSIFPSLDNAKPNELWMMSGIFFSSSSGVLAISVTGGRFSLLHAIIMQQKNEHKTKGYNNTVLRMLKQRCGGDLIYTTSISLTHIYNKLSNPVSICRLSICYFSKMLLINRTKKEKP